MSASMYGAGPGAGAGQAIFTDDVSLQVFMESLKRLVRIPSLFLHIWNADERVCAGRGCADQLKYLLDRRYTRRDFVILTFFLNYSMNSLRDYLAYLRTGD
jgi:hypothetical protein